MKNIISSCIVLCLLLVSHIGFAQDRIIKQIHIDAAKNDISEIKKSIELTGVEEEEIYKVLLDKNEYLNEYPSISVVRRNWNVENYMQRIKEVLDKSTKKEKYSILEKNNKLLEKINLNLIPETNN
ncbi:hypothetical protein [Myroides marinus]|uniref:hypothetical protein n=1 Tax=Myroides TaxID=76831 RepID=UPI002576161A|nr:hypothetical protein [Myroides marinus]MDM1379969.1 hypothetical protein [Myroides marinus]MDM1387240.1 hypothetical protein [Myroides marinus]MDM1394453.1 hypothetical protein [Myroides marinus]MDM1405411.1 hypothetical protein [Myroides marinus]